MAICSPLLSHDLHGVAQDFVGSCIVVGVASLDCPDSSSFTFFIAMLKIAELCVCIRFSVFDRSSAALKRGVIIT